MLEQLNHQTFAELERTIKSHLKGRSWATLHGCEWGVLILRAMLFIFGFVMFAQTGRIPKLLALPIISYAYYGIGITGTHESRHLSFASSKKANLLWSYFFSDFWSGQSSEWWEHRHVELHHCNTNIPGKETANFYYPWLSKYVYFFVAPFLVTVWMVINSMYYLRNNLKGLSLYLFLGSFGFVLHTTLFWLFVPFWWALACNLIMRSLYAPIFMHLAVFNHIGLSEPSRHPPWILHQTITTRNVKRNWFLTGMGGNAFVECHLEHHLFPTLSNHILGKIRPRVKEFLNTHGYVYLEQSYYSLLKECLDRYQDYFKNQAIPI